MIYQKNKQGQSLFNIWESVNATGTSVNIFGSDLMLSKVSESVSSKLGGNAFVNKFMEIVVDTTLNDSKDTQNRQIERNVVVEGSKGGKEFKKDYKSKTTTSTTKT